MKIVEFAYLRPRFGEDIRSMSYYMVYDFVDFSDSDIWFKHRIDSYNRDLVGIIISSLRIL